MWKTERIRIVNSTALKYTDLGPRSKTKKGGLVRPPSIGSGNSICLWEEGDLHFRIIIEYGYDLDQAEFMIGNVLDLLDII